MFVGILSSLGFRAAEQGAVVALDAASGRELWRRKNLCPSRSPVSDGRGVVCTTYAKSDGKSYLLDAKAGATLWTGPSAFHYNTATITEKLVLIRPYGAACYGLDRGTGEERWRFQVPKVTSGCCSPAVSGRYAYYGTGVVAPGDLESLFAFGHEHPPRETGLTGTMHAVDLETGKSVWQFSTANCICGDPAIAYGRLYFHSRDGRVYCFAPTLPPGPTVPVAADDGAGATADVVASLLQADRMDRPRAGRDWPMQGGAPHRAGLEMTCVCRRRRNRRSLRSRRHQAVDVSVRRHVPCKPRGRRRLSASRLRRRQVVCVPGIRALVGYRRRHLGRNETKPGIDFRGAGRDHRG